LMDEKKSRPFCPLKDIYLVLGARDI